MLLRSFILTGAVNGLFFILLLNSKAQKSDSDRILMLWMAIIALLLGFYYDNLSPRPVFPVGLQLFCFSLPLINAPLFYFYIRSLSIGYRFKWVDVPYRLSPALAFNCMLLFLHRQYPEFLFFKDAYPHFSTVLHGEAEYVLTSFLAIIPGYYAISGFWVLLKHQKQLPDNYSYTEKINLNWLKWIVISLFILFVGLFMLIRYGVNLGFVDSRHLFAVVGLCLTIYVFFIGFGGLKQEAVVNNAAAVNTIVDKPDTAVINYKNSGLSDELAEKIFIRLKFHMDKEQPFLKDDLSLATLAAEIGITANQLSQVINQQSGSNFFNFVNGYRVEAVKNKFKNPSMAAYSILGIAYDCGFRSKSSFNKIFKETTGQTPIQYRNAVNS